jgi:hypothetical protein
MTSEMSSFPSRHPVRRSPMRRFPLRHRGQAGTWAWKALLAAMKATRALDASGRRTGAVAVVMPDTKRKGAWRGQEGNPTHALHQAKR